MMGVSLTCLILSLYVRSHHSFYQSTPEVIELSEETFKTEVTTSKKFYLVQFYTPQCSRCKSIVSDWIKIAQTLEAVLQVGAVDAAKHKSVAKMFKIKDFPAFALFAFDKSQPIVFSGDKTLKDIVTWALLQLKSVTFEKLGIEPEEEKNEEEEKSESSGGSTGEVVTLTAENFESTIKGSTDHWIVEFFAPWCGHCKNLAPHYAEAARALKGTAMRLAAVDATVHQQLASQFGISGYPSLKYIAPGSLNLAGDAVDYTGGRTSADIISWCQAKLQAVKPMPKLVELVDQKTFDKECYKKSLCVIAFVPDLMDSSVDERNTMLDYIKTAIPNFPRTWGWAWSVAASQLDFEDSLGIGGFGYPAMVAIHSGKKLSSTLKGAFDQKGINEFLRNLQSGRTHVSKFDGLASIVTVKAWDGKSADIKDEL